MPRFVGRKLGGVHLVCFQPNIWFNDKCKRISGLECRTSYRSKHDSRRHADGPYTSQTYKGRWSDISLVSQTYQLWHLPMQYNHQIFCIWYILVFVFVSGDFRKRRYRSTQLPAIWTMDNKNKIWHQRDGLTCWVISRYPDRRDIVDRGKRGLAPTLALNNLADVGFHLYL